jgi:hypothetical protein
MQHFDRVGFSTPLLWGWLERACSVQGVASGAYYWVLGDQPACPFGWVDWDSDPGSWDVLLMVLGSTVR